MKNKFVFTHLAEKGVYLNTYTLAKANKIFEETREKSGLIQALYAIESEYLPKKEKFSDKNKGAFVDDNLHNKWTGMFKSEILQYDMDGKLIDSFPSIYAAATSLGDKNKSSNISKAVNGRLSSAYTFKWVKI